MAPMMDFRSWIAEFVSPSTSGPNKVTPPGQVDPKKIQGKQFVNAAAVNAMQQGGDVNVVKAAVKKAMAQAMRAGNLDTTDVTKLLPDEGQKAPQTMMMKKKMGKK